MSYIRRTLETQLRRSLAQFPVIVLTGPRQSGKTTLLKHLLFNRCRYVSLDLPEFRLAAVSDPRAFFEVYPPPVILDEIQHAPELLPYIKAEVDARRNLRGRFILTGSQNIQLSERVTETLAGRAAMLRLLPLSRREIAGKPEAQLPWQQKRRGESGAIKSAALWKSFLRGGYPELTAHPKFDAQLWHSSYIQTYLERDIRSLRQIGDLTQFQSFLRALAARSAQLLNLTDIAHDLGVAVNTVKAWLSMLEGTFQILILRPYFSNIGKRLVKSPKVYFTDVGTLCHLVGLRDPAHAMSGPMGGAIMETAVINEIHRTLTHQGGDP